MTDREIFGWSTTLDEDAPFSNMEGMLELMEAECGPEVFEEILRAQVRYQLVEQARL